MRSPLLHTLLSFLLFNSSARCQRLWQFNKDTIVAWYYAGGDEFNSPVPDTARWSYWYGWSRSIFSQREQEYYSNGQNHRIADGHLNLFALKKDTIARMIDWLPDRDSLIIDGRFYGLNKQLFRYTSGMIQSRQKYQYGYFEIRFRMPADKGFWPAFWLYGGTPNEEIDWMELKTEKANAIHVGRHSKKKEENKLRKGLGKRWWGDWVYFKGNLSQGYHVISGEWNPRYVKYFLNGECIAYSEVALPEPKLLCANLAVPGDDGSFRPGPDKQLARSGNFDIDYIRIWTSGERSAIPFPDTAPTAPSDTSASTRLRSKTKFLYGSHTIHRHEGFTLTLVPSGNGRYDLQALGKDIPSNATFTLRYGLVEQSNSLRYGSNFFKLPEKAGSVELIVRCYGRSLSHIITP